MKSGKTLWLAIHPRQDQATHIGIDVWNYYEWNYIRLIDDRTCVEGRLILFAGRYKRDVLWDSPRSHGVNPIGIPPKTHTSVMVSAEMNWICSSRKAKLLYHGSFILPATVKFQSLEVALLPVPASLIFGAASQPQIVGLRLGSTVCS